MRCVVTGGRGFIGRALLPALQGLGWSASSWDRATAIGTTGVAFDLEVTDSDMTRALWQRELAGVDVIVHMAARVHQLRESAADADALYRRINCEGTALLAQAAAAAGVKKFIFLSSAKVFGEGGDGPYGSSSPARPQDAYAVAKFEAEQALERMAASGNMEIVIIRPPLVYGPGVGANFERLQRLTESGWPLPFAGVHNRRAMVGVGNLVDLIVFAMRRKLASGTVLLAADAVPYSLSDIIATMRSVRGKTPRLFYFPASWLDAMIRVVLGAPTAERLLGNFEIDIGATRALGWSPPFTMAEELRRGAGGGRR